MKTEDLTKSLRKHAFFAGLRNEDTQLIASCTSNRRLQPDEFLFREGEPCKSLYFIRKGSVALQLTAPGQVALSAETLGPGDALGWRVLFPNSEWHVDARCLTPCVVFEIEARCLKKKSEQDPKFALLFTQQLLYVAHRRLVRARLQLIDVYRNELAQNDHSE